jgi:alcohol dehydrogenase
MNNQPRQTMKALVFRGAGEPRFEDRDKPSIQAATDAIVRVVKTTICGTDLHILKGHVPTVAPGRILGHEGVGVVEQIGESVASFRIGDRVLISCISSCGMCSNCKKGMYSHCLKDGGWILGNRIDGTQAEFVRIPFADNSLYSIPPGANEESFVMLSDILPTGFEIGVINGCVKLGDIIAIVGCGPIGIAALMTAQFYSPTEIIAVDIDDNRLEIARKLGATQTINNGDGNAISTVMQLTHGEGVNVAIEAVGESSAFDVCQGIVAAGGHIANVGVHGKPVQLNLDKLWSENITLTTGLVNTSSTSLLIKAVASQKLQPSQLITHRFKFRQILQAYQTFGNAMQEKAMKVILSNDP